MIVYDPEIDYKLSVLKEEETKQGKQLTIEAVDPNRFKIETPVLSKIGSV